MLAQDIKQRMFEAMKAGRIVEKEILRVLLGEIQTAGLRQEEPLGDEDVIRIIRKLMKSNEETISACDNPEQVAPLRQELAILEELVPKALDEVAVALALADVRDAIVSANSAGQAVGVAMKHLKAAGAVVTGNVVTAAVARLRS